MLGFGVVVYKRDDDKGPNTELGDLRIARWMTNPWGLKWIDKLVEEGKARRLEPIDPVLNFNFVVPAKVLVPILAAGIPPSSGPAIFGDDYYLPAGWQGELEINKERLAACEDDDELVIEAWDMS